MKADRRQTGFNSRVAENTLFHLSAGPIVIGFLVGAGRDAVAPVATSVLINENNAVFFPLVSGAGWTGTDTTGIETMIAYTGKIKIEDISEFKECFFLRFAHILEIDVVLSGNVGTAGVVFPVYTPIDGDIFLFGYHGFG
jgi:hypothetical protein